MKNVSKLLPMLVLALTICMFLLPVNVRAADDYTSGDWTYTVSDGYATVTGYTGSSKTITIPSTLGGYTVTGIGESAFKDSTIISVTIPPVLPALAVRHFTAVHS